MIFLVIGCIGITMDPRAGALPAFVVFVMGTLYILVIGGLMYLIFGLYRNTQETNRLLGELLRR